MGWQFEFVFKCPGTNSKQLDYQRFHSGGIIAARDLGDCYRSELEKAGGPPREQYGLLAAELVPGQPLRH